MATNRYAVELCPELLVDGERPQQAQALLLQQRPLAPPRTHTQIKSGKARAAAAGQGCGADLAHSVLSTWMMAATPCGAACRWARPSRSLQSSRSTPRDPSRMAASKPPPASSSPPLPATPALSTVYTCHTSPGPCMVSPAVARC